MVSKYKLAKGVKMVLYIRCFKCNHNGKDIVADRFKEHTFYAHPEENSGFKPNDVQFYSEHVQQLAETQQHKIKKFIAYKCLEYVAGGVYICKPLAGYNKTTYRLTKENSIWHCTCQAFNRYSEATPDYFCSHKGALYEFFALKQRYPNISMVE